MPCNNLLVSETTFRTQLISHICHRKTIVSSITSPISTRSPISTNHFFPFPFSGTFFPPPFPPSPFPPPPTTLTLLGQIHGITSSSTAPISTLHHNQSK